MEHSGASFVNSCIKVPIDPYSRQPTPSYERPKVALKSEKRDKSEKNRKTNFIPKSERVADPSNLEMDHFLAFIDSIPDYGEVHHLSNKQFKQKLDYLKRQQKLLLRNLRNYLGSVEGEEQVSELFKENANDVVKMDGNNIKNTGGGAKMKKGKQDSNRKKQCCVDNDGNLKLKGKKCNIEESCVSSPLLFSYGGAFTGLAKDQDLLTGYSFKTDDKIAKTMRNKEILSSDRSWSLESDIKSNRSIESDPEINIETKSLPPQSPQKWHPTVPKPFSFTLREDAEKYMSNVELQSEKNSTRPLKKKTPAKKRRVKKVPITSTIPLYDKLIAEKEERSRIVREASALNLLSQVRPFKLECDRRAWRSLSRSSPELSNRRNTLTSSRFKAKSVPRNLFSTELYERMLEDEYYRLLQKRIRSMELMKASTLPPSMAKRQRVKSASSHSHDGTSKDSFSEKSQKNYLRSLYTPTSSERSRSATALLSSRGNNLAAILRCQASREKMEREIQEQLEERHREQDIKLKKALLAQKPAWRALRSTARYEHERDLEYRNRLRRNEAREQAERHRLQMELMLNRVTQIPLLFERHSQSFQNALELYTKYNLENATHKSKKKQKGKKQSSSSIESCASLGSSSSLRPNSGSPVSSSGTVTSSSKSSKSSEFSEKSTLKLENSNIKKKSDRGMLKVSINETAELIEDNHNNDDVYSLKEHEKSLFEKNKKTYDNDK